MSNYNQEIDRIKELELEIENLKQQKAELIQVLRDVLDYAGQEEFLEACVKADAVLNKLQKEN